MKQLHISPQQPTLGESQRPRCIPHDTCLGLPVWALPLQQSCRRQILGPLWTPVPPHRTVNVKWNPSWAPAFKLQSDAPSRSVQSPDNTAEVRDRGLGAISPGAQKMVHSIGHSAFRSILNHKGSERVKAEKDQFA